MATGSGPATTPRSTAPARTSGAPAPSTSTRPAAPTGPVPSAPTTGSCWAPWCPTRTSPLTSCPRPAGCTSARLSFRCPRRGRRSRFTKCELLGELGREHATACAGKSLGVFDGGFAVRSVVRPLVQPNDPTLPRVDILTRLRHDARLHALPPQQRKPGQRGVTPKWGKRLPPPRQGGRWPGAWQTGQACLYGRLRAVRSKEVVCQWHVLGHDVPVKAVIAEVEGYRKRFTLVTSATDLSGLQVVELFCARFRQEDAFRDLKGRLGWEQCRAWTRNPIERTTQTLLVTMTALRLLQLALQEQAGDAWWLHPPWNPHKSRPSVLDVERLLRQHREQIQQGLADWLDSEGKTREGGPPPIPM